MSTGNPQDNSTAGEQMHSLWEEITELRDKLKVWQQIAESAEHRAMVAADEIERLRAMPADAVRIYTYEDQPTDNVIPWRLGEACQKAAKAPGGDYIDGGLSLLKELQAKGYGVVALDARRRIEGES